MFARQSLACLIALATGWRWHDKSLCCSCATVDNERHEAAAPDRR
jgi:hypothetical protein